MPWNLGLVIASFRYVSWFRYFIARLECSNKEGKTFKINVEYSRVVEYIAEVQNFRNYECMFK